MSTSNLSRPLPNLSDQAQQLRALLEQKRSPPSSTDTSRNEPHKKTTASRIPTTTVAPKVVQPITGRVSPRTTPSPNVTSPRGSIFFGGGGGAGAKTERECEHDEDAVRPPTNDKGFPTGGSVSGLLQENLSSSSFSSSTTTTSVTVARWHNTKPSVRKLKASSNEKKKHKMEDNKQETVDNHGIEEGALTIEDVPPPMVNEGNRSRRNSEECKEISMKAQVLRAFLNPKKSKKDPIKREWLETEEPIIVPETGVSTLESDMPDNGLLVPEPDKRHEIAQELLATQKDLEDAKNENMRLQSENENLLKERNDLKLDLERKDEIEEYRIKESEALKNQLSETRSGMKTKEDLIEQLQKDVLMAQENLEAQKQQLHDARGALETEKREFDNKMKELDEIFQEEKSILQERALDLENQLQASQALRDEENLSMEQKLAENEEKLNEVFTDLHNERNLREKCENELKAINSELDSEIMKNDSLEAEKDDLVKQLEDQTLTHQKQMQDQKDSLAQDVKIQEGIAEIFQRENERLIKELHDCEQNSKAELNKFKEKLKKLETEKSEQLQQINDLEEQLQIKDDSFKSAEAESKRITEELKKDLDEKKKEIETLEKQLSELETKNAESLSLVEIHSSLQENLEKTLQDKLNDLQDTIRAEMGGETVSEQLLDSLSKENELLRRNAEKERVRFEEARQSAPKSMRREDEMALSRNQEMMELNQQYQMQLQNCATVLKIIRKTVLQW